MAVDGASLFGSRGPAGPKGYRGYAIGDVHGRLDLLEAILARVAEDAQGCRRSRTLLIFLGDLIDRGPDSAQVVERLRVYEPGFARAVFLMGNHEEVMLRVLAGEMQFLGDWLRFGGAECLQSYGLDPEELRALPPAQALELLNRAVPEEHVAFLRSFADSLSFGSYVFVHAGIRPGVALAEQAQKDMRWIRQPFLDHEGDHGFIVVHGHTITDQVDERTNRIGIDTGAYRSGVLTAMAIEGRKRWFLQTGDAIAGTSEADQDSVR